MHEVETETQIDVPMISETPSERNPMRKGYKNVEIRVVSANGMTLGLKDP